MGMGPAYVDIIAGGGGVEIRHHCRYGRQATLSSPLLP